MRQLRNGQTGSVAIDTAANSNPLAGTTKQAESPALFETFTIQGGTGTAPQNEQVSAAVFAFAQGGLGLQQVGALKKLSVAVLSYTLPAWLSCR